MIWLLLILVILLCVLTIWLFKKDFFAPAFIVCLVFVISTVFCIYNYERWELWNYHFYTVFVIVSCLVVFIIVSYLTNKLCEKKTARNTKSNKALSSNRKNVVGQSIINLNIWIKIGLLALFVGMIVLSVYEVFRIASLTDFDGSFFAMLENYRKMTSYSLKYQPTLLFRVLQKVTTGLCYVLIYIIIRNLFNKDKFRKNIVYLVCILLFIVQSFTVSARAPILRIAAAALFLIFIFANRRVKWQKNLFSKFMKVGAICFVVLLIGFFATKGLTGRGKNYDPMNYLSIYAGGSIELLDLYLEKPAEKVEGTVGKETFYGLNSALSRVGIGDVKYTKHLEFRKVKKSQVGNVYTPFRRYIADFGLFGCYILVAIVSAIFSWMYFCITSIAKRKTYDKDWLVVLYSLIVYVLFLYSIDDQLFTTVISFNYVMIAVIVWLSYYLLIEPNKIKNYLGSVQKRLQKK